MLQVVRASVNGTQFEVQYNHWNKMGGHCPVLRDALACCHFSYARVQINNGHLLSILMAMQCY